MALTKSERGALPDDSFAVPGKRKIPIPDARHLSMGWDMIERTSGLNADERKDARRRILHRAKELGMDTSDWNKIKAMSIQAMALNMPDVADHPNRMPFSGVMTKVGEPSDAAPHGSDGRLVIMTHDAAEKAIPSLIGMAVNLTADLGGHDPKAKIGIITAADVVGNDLLIEGFIYASDFPNEAARIRTDKDLLGFSFETVENYVSDPGADPLELVSCVFTGAAILLKDRAAYRTTSLIASADQDIPMTPEELKALLGDTLAAALKPVNDANAALTAEVAQLKAASAEQIKKLDASKAVMDKVEPHAAGLEAAADKMEADGIGAAMPRGHANVMRSMAKTMRATAAMGKTPDTYSDYSMYAGAATVEKTDLAADVAVAVAKAVEPIQAAADKIKTDLEARLADSETKLRDALAAKAATSSEPARKTLSPAITALLAKAGIGVPEGDAKLGSAEVDKTLAGLPMVKRIELKTLMAKAGIIS